MNESIVLYSTLVTMIATVVIAVATVCNYRSTKSIGILSLILYVMGNTPEGSGYSIEFPKFKKQFDERYSEIAEMLNRKGK